MLSFLVWGIKDLCGWGKKEPNPGRWLWRSEEEPRVWATGSDKSRPEVGNWKESKGLWLSELERERLTGKMETPVMPSGQLETSDFMLYLYSISSVENALLFKILFSGRGVSVCVSSLRISRWSVFKGSLTLFKYSWGGGDYMLKFQTSPEWGVAGHPLDWAPRGVTAASFPIAGFVNTHAPTPGHRLPH